MSASDPSDGKIQRLWRVAALGLLGLAVACSSGQDEASRTALPTVEPEPATKAIENRAAPLPADSREGLGGSFGDADESGVPPPEAPASPKAPDTGALSELDHRNARNLSQRANEAFDYLGPLKQELAGDDADGMPSVAEEIAQRGSRLAPGRDEAYRLRDANRAHVREKKLSRLQLRQLRALGYVIEGGSSTGDKGRARKDDARGEVATLSPAQRFERERRTLEPLRFQPSTGYWANTYVPGDPVMRWLETRLEEGERQALQSFAKQPLRLDAGVRQVSQPFDPPSSAALSVFLQADRRGLEGEERMLLQVGLQGAHRRSGLRPAMSVGIVLDVRGALPPDAATGMRALVDAFLQAKDAGDHFSLTVAGAPGGELVGADAFRHGPLSLALASLFADGSRTRRAPQLGLVEAVQQTATQLQKSDDPTAPLGSSMVLLVTSQPFGSHTDALVATAHRSAVAGVPLSVVSVGEAVDHDQIERVTLAGQGNRRVLRAPAEAEALVNRELSALARVIARALRLNIRLAPGVKLVEVVGSERLDAAGAQQVRQAERSIDRRLSRNLGIEADRGEDEDGIQIVIPTFHSSDSHAVLLDVVAPGPGPIADVTVRYKDLVYLRNSVARDNLTLGRSNAPPGPLQRNVVKNFLAARLAATLKQAGRSLLEGGDAETLALVRDFQALLASLQREVPGFQNDADLATDRHLLEEYLALLETPILDRDEPRRHLADSLQLSGYFKTVPRSRPEIRTAWR